MKRTNWPFAVLCALLVVLLSLSARTINARDADTADKQCINKCRARYDNCIQLKQLSQSECQGIYQEHPHQLQPGWGCDKAATL